MRLYKHNIEEFKKIRDFVWDYSPWIDIWGYDSNGYWVEIEDNADIPKEELEEFLELCWSAREGYFDFIYEPNDDADKSIKELMDMNKHFDSDVYWSKQNIYNF